MIQINEKLYILENEVELNFIRSSGPGGQNVNKVSSAVHLRFDITKSSLPEQIKSLLFKMNDHHITADGVIIIKALSFRTQELNKVDAIARLKSIILKALIKRKKRVPTKPSKNSQKRRMDNKSRHGQKKVLRGRLKVRESSDL